ncbi:MAG: TrbC/VirB2 family protein [Pseudomonadota bacterium]
MGILKSFDFRNFSKTHFTVVTTFVVSALIAEPALAQDLSPITRMLTAIGTALTGPLGRAAGLVALAVCGLLFMTGRMSWQFAASVIIGLVILFGSATILEGF